MDEGILQFGGTAYNLNPTPVTYNGPATAVLTPGQIVQPAGCPAGACDPRGLGISPTQQAIWTQVHATVKHIDVRGNHEVQWIKHPGLSRQHAFALV